MIRMHCMLRCRTFSAYAAHRSSGHLEAQGQSSVTRSPAWVICCPIRQTPHASAPTSWCGGRPVAIPRCSPRTHSRRSACQSSLGYTAEMHLRAGTRQLHSTPAHVNSVGVPTAHTRAYYGSCTAILEPRPKQSRAVTGLTSPHIEQCPPRHRRPTRIAPPSIPVLTRKVSLSKEKWAAPMPRQIYLQHVPPHRLA